MARTTSTGLAATLTADALTADAFTVPLLLLLPVAAEAFSGSGAAFFAARAAARVARGITTATTDSKRLVRCFVVQKNKYVHEAGEVVQPSRELPQEMTTGKNTRFSAHRVVPLSVEGSRHSKTPNHNMKRAAVDQRKEEERAAVFDTGRSTLATARVRPHPTSHPSPCSHGEGGCCCCAVVV